MPDNNPSHQYHCGLFAGNKSVSAIQNRALVSHDGEAEPVLLNAGNQAGEVVALGDILNRVTGTYECRVLAVELHKVRKAGSRNRWVYSVKAMTQQGHILMFKIDGKSMKFLNIAGRGADDARRKP